MFTFNNCSALGQDNWKLVSYLYTGLHCTAQGQRISWSKYHYLWHKVWNPCVGYDLRRPLISNELLVKLMKGSLPNSLSAYNRGKHEPGSWMQQKAECVWDRLLGAYHGKPWWREKQASGGRQQNLQFWCDMGKQFKIWGGRGRTMRGCWACWRSQQRRRWSGLLEDSLSSTIQIRYSLCLLLHTNSNSTIHSKSPFLKTHLAERLWVGRGKVQGNCRSLRGASCW